MVFCIDESIVRCINVGVYRWSVKLSDSLGLGSVATLAVAALAFRDFWVLGIV